MGFSSKIETTPTLSNCKFNFYLGTVHIGQIIFHITCDEASIG